MPRILIISENFPPKLGGTARLYHELYRHLPKGETVVLADRDPDSPAFDAACELPILRMPLAMKTCGLMNLHDLKRYAGHVRAIRRIVREHGVEQVHCGRLLFEGFAAYLAGKIRGTPYLVHVHGEELSGIATSRELTWMTHRALRSAALVLASSHNARRLLLDEWKVPEARIRVLHPGVDTKRLAPAPPDAEWRERMGWGGRTVILTVSRLQERKGQDTMIRALPAILGKHPGVLYAIVGGGEREPHLRKLAAELGLADRVQFLGPLDDDASTRCYQQCDLFALPNRQVGPNFEGFGMVLLEAQACGKPVIAGASGGTAETMRIPETGRRVHCETPGPLAETVLELLADPAGMRRMGEQAREWALGFDWIEVAKKASALFAEVK
jgi:phosphatidylinositol alpha-1,6-mannosyltransferase